MKTKGKTNPAAEIAKQSPITLEDEILDGVSGGVADDSSGYQISERMRVQLRALGQAGQAAQNGEDPISSSGYVVAIPSK